MTANIRGYWWTMLQMGYDNKFPSSSVLQAVQCPDHQEQGCMAPSAIMQRRVFSVMWLYAKQANN
jgi:hypothetical protein